MAWLGSCSNTGSEIVVGGEVTTPGSWGTTPVNEPHADGGAGGKTYPRPEFDFERCLKDWDSRLRCFRPEDKAVDPPEDEAEPGLPPLTIADLARFAPPGTNVVAEPENVGVVGLPTNVVAAAAAHHAVGELLGVPISVRFTPVRYDLSFGDGTTVSTTQPGLRWTELGQATFTPTPSSHVYATRGTYTAHVDVRYRADVDLGAGWFPVTGEVTAPGPGQPIRVFEAHTALVARTCAQTPDAPGC